jgi:signal transduction histidine kinase
VKHIVQLHQGSLRIESRLGVGTTVTVTIPAAESQKIAP